jgi:S-adenosylmethionine hydrolase
LLLAETGWPARHQSLQCDWFFNGIPVERSHVVPGKIEGTVVAYSPAGNLVTDIANDRLAGVPQSGAVNVRCDEHETIGIFPADHQEEPCTLLAIRGASGYLELTIVGDSAKIMLGVPLREKVIVQW